MYKSNPEFRAALPTPSATPPGQVAERPNNTCALSGRVLCAPTYSHTAYGQVFLRFELEVPRLSGQTDLLPIMLPRRLLRGCAPMPGESVCVEGQFRSYNRMQNGASRLILVVFAHCWQLLSALPEQTNAIALEGHLCKPPMYRTTPFAREITDLLLAVRRNPRRSDYIPCICWGAIAREAAGLRVGDKLRVHGRIQSREYDKQLESGAFVRRRVYEVSIASLRRVASP